MAHPTGFAPRTEVVATARELTNRRGARLEIVEDPMAAVRGADAIYADVWASMGQEEDADRRGRRLTPPERRCE